MHISPAADAPIRSDAAKHPTAPATSGPAPQEAPVDTFERTAHTLDKELDMAVTQVSRGLRGMLYSLADALSSFTERTLRRLATRVRDMGGSAVAELYFLMTALYGRVNTWMGNLRG